MRITIFYFCVIFSPIALARGGVCYTDECKESSIWMLYFFGFVGVAIFTADKYREKTGNNIILDATVIISSLVTALISAIVSLGVVYWATGNNIHIVWRMLLAWILSYVVFGYSLVKYGKL